MLTCINAENYPATVPFLLLLTYAALADTHLMSDRSCREGSNLSSSTCSAGHNLSQLFQLFRPDYNR